MATEQLIAEARSAALFAWVTIHLMIAQNHFLIAYRAVLVTIARPLEARMRRTKLKSAQLQKIL